MRIGENEGSRVVFMVHWNTNPMKLRVLYIERGFNLKSGWLFLFISQCGSAKPTVDAYAFDFYFVSSNRRAILVLCFVRQHTVVQIETIALWFINNDNF